MIVGKSRLGRLLYYLLVVMLIGLAIAALAAGTPFVATNVRRLHIIAAAFGLVALIRLIVPLFVPVDTAAILQLEGPTFDIGPILMALVVVVLAQIFAEGRRLREDVEGTI